MPYARHGPTLVERRATLTEQCRTWLASGPGTFSDRDMNKAVVKAHSAFCAFSGSVESEEFFEEVLKEFTGHWRGGVGVGGSYLWIMILPGRSPMERARRIEHG